MERIVKQRLANQGFYPARFKAPAESVAWLGAIQGQDYQGAKWSLGLRIPGSLDKTIEEAIANQAIVRTWAMRGTLHFVAAEDLHWLLRLLGPRVIKTNGRRYRQLDLDEATLARADTILASALQDGRLMNRQELREVLESEGISTAGQRMVYMLQHASLTGLICQGTAPKNQPLFILAPQPAKSQQAFNRQEALAELALRYFRSRGPATLDDFIWWSGLLVADAKTGLEGAKPKLVEQKEGTNMTWQPDSSSAILETIPEIILLPGFDEYLVSYRDRGAMIPDAYHQAWSRSKAMFSPSILLRGRVAGLWKRSFKKDHVLITPNLFVDLTEHETASLEAAAQGYGRFLGKNVKFNTYKCEVFRLI
jgi:hypothetical protein